MPSVTSQRDDFANCVMEHSCFQLAKEANDGFPSYFPDRIEMTWLLWEIRNA